MTAGCIDSLFSLREKVVLVTGGAAGIGRACARALAEYGAHVVVADVDELQGNATAVALQAPGRKAMFVRCDVTKSAEVAALVDTVARELGRLDILVNSAGIYCEASDEQQSEEDWRRVLDINLTGTWLCARAAMRQMIRQPRIEGKIINIASISGSMAGSNGSYDASKAAVLHLTRTLAARWGAYDINVNAISPGYVGTVFGRERSAEEEKMLCQVTPLGRMQRLEDLHGAVVFLASRASDYVTGQNLVVDGGHTLSTWMLPLERRAPPRGPDVQ